MREKTISLLFLAALITALAGCAAAATAPKTLTLISYNLMTLFDPVDQGGEYDGWQVSKGEWDETRYKARLANTAAAILGLQPGGPDILVTVEAENRRVLQDLAEKLGGYLVIIASPEEKALLSCGVLSRYPLRQARAHLATPPSDIADSIPRYMLEAELDVAGRRLVILAAHWKSKLGGAAETEKSRRFAADLARRIMLERLAEDSSVGIILAGDLNENPDEFELVDREYPTALMPASMAAGPGLYISGDPEDARSVDGELVLFSPWEQAGGYSYKYAGKEERIDHILLSPNLLNGTSFRFESFSAEPPAFLVDEKGQPIRWNQAGNSGYSDHLPLRLVLAVVKKEPSINP